MSDTGAAGRGSNVLLERDDLARTELLDDLAAMQQAKAWAEAAEARLLAQIDAWRPEHLEGHEPAAKRWERDRWLREDVSVIMRLASTTAGGRMAAATKLVTELPGVLAALEAGLLTGLHTRVALEAAAPFDAAQCAEFEQRVLRNCGQLSVAEFRARCRRAVIAVDPDGAARRHEVAKADRKVRISADEDGMATLYAGMTAADAARVRQRLDSHTQTVEAEWAAHAARSDHDGDGAETRTRDQLRADLVVDLLTGGSVPSAADGIAADGVADRGSAAAAVQGPAAAPRPIEVIVPFTTLLGLDDLPGEIAGEPVTAAVARELAAQVATNPNVWWRPVLVDRGGYLEYVGARTYRPSDPLRRFTQRRDRTCRFPGCRRAAVRCEDDHVDAFDLDEPTLGGLTVPENLHSLCKRHHRLKHETGWKVARDRQSTMWTSPDGFEYLKNTEPYLDPRDLAAHPAQDTAGLDPPPESVGESDPPPF